MTILDETNPLDTNLVGEADDHIRTAKSTIADLLKKGHCLAASSDTVNDGHLKFGERVKDDYDCSTDVELDFSKGITMHFLTLEADISVTFGDPPDVGDGTTPYDGFGFVVIAKQTTGGHDITWPSAIKWVNGADPYQNTAATAETHYSFYTVCGGLGDNGAGWYGMVIGDFNV